MHRPISKQQYCLKFSAVLMSNVAVLLRQSYPKLQVIRLYYYCKPRSFGQQDKYKDLTRTTNEVATSQRLAHMRCVLQTHARALLRSVSLQGFDSYSINRVPVDTLAMSLNRIVASLRQQDGC